MTESRFRHSDVGWRQLFEGLVALVGMTILGLGLLVQLTWALTWVFGDVVAAAILAGSAPLIASMGLGIWTTRVERRRQMGLERLQLKAEAFRGLLDFLYESVQKTEAGETPGAELEREDYRSLLEDVLAWSSDDLIELWNEFRALDFSELDRDEQLRWYGRILEQVRHELRDESELTAEALYELYMLDPEQLPER